MEQSVFLPGRRTAKEKKNMKKLKQFLVLKWSSLKTGKTYVVLPLHEQRSSDFKNIKSQYQTNKQMGLGPLLHVLPVDKQKWYVSVCVH